MSQPQTTQFRVPPPPWKPNWLGALTRGAHMSYATGPCADCQGFFRDIFCSLFSFQIIAAFREQPLQTPCSLPKLNLLCKKIDPRENPEGNSGLCRINVRNTVHKSSTLLCLVVMMWLK